MVAHMVIRADAVEVELSLVEGPVAPWSARCEELRWAEVAARNDAGLWKSRFETSRKHLTAAVEEMKAVRRAAKDALFLQAEVARLTKLLSDAGVEPGKRRARVSLSQAVRELKQQQNTIKSLSRENTRLRKGAKASQNRIETLEARLARLRATRRSLSKTVSGTDAELRRVLRRSRCQKTALKSLSRENTRLRKGAKASQNRIEMLAAQLTQLRATRAVLSKTLFGRKSEQQETPRSGRRRGQQPGAAGHGRTQRSALDERTEEHHPPAATRTCSCCGKPYVANGTRVSSLIEIEVKAHTRVIHRPRWHRTCTCTSSPREVSAPPVPRLFVNTPYGTSVWARFLFERYACLRPLERVAAWLCDQGLPISPGTLGDSVVRFVPLFEPLAEAILAHQNEATLRHGDETAWRIQSLRERGRSSRAWLWTSVSQDAVYFHIDPSRSAAAAARLFGDAAPGTVLVCDRYSAYKKLARDLAGVVVLAWCWSHMRRDFIKCAAGQERLTQWCQGWIERIASIYRLNAARLAQYDPHLMRQTTAFAVAQDALQEALDSLFAAAERELAALLAPAREGKALRSLVNHREGLSRFVDHPQVCMDNNAAERALRGPVIGRRLSFGSDSETGARFTAMMYSVVGTLAANGIKVQHWLQAWLGACAANGGRPPDDMSSWLPWSMREDRKRTLMAPG